MDSTITVQDLVDYARTHVKLAPLESVGGFTSQPALRWANKVKKRIINRPYNWEWNRKSVPSFITVNEKDEYPVTVQDIGWLESCYATLEASTAVPKASREIEVRKDLKKSWYKSDPERIALSRAESGLPVLRIDPMPSSTVWRIHLDYQRKASKIASLSDTFDPIPDDMEDVLSQFFVAFAFKLVDKREHMAELAEAERLLQGFLAYSEPEDDGTLFVPEHTLFLG